MSKADSTNGKNEGVPNAAEVSAKEKKDLEAEIGRRLNDKIFLNFLKKNPDAVDNATNNEYLKGKIALYERVQKVKQDVKKYITLGSREDFGSIVDGPFVDSIETIAIESPSEFLSFSTNVSKYLESLEKNKGLESIYKAAAKSLGMEIDYDKLSGPEKLNFIQEVQGNYEALIKARENELSDVNENRSFFTHVWKTESRQNWKNDVAKLTSVIKALKAGEKKLDIVSISVAVEDMEKIKGNLKGNQAFEIVRKAFLEESSLRVNTALAYGNDSDLIRNRETLDRLRANQSLISEDEYNEMSQDIERYSKEKVTTGTETLIEGNKEMTLTSFENGIKSMKKKGLDLGLSKQECTEQISDVLRNKIDELSNNQSEGQNMIKLILAKRILANIDNLE